MPVTEFDAGATSKLTQDARVNWLSHKIEGNLQEVPGIGPKAEEKLKAAGITTTFQLFGKFCMLKGDDVANSQEHCNAFFNWLAGIGINSHRASITLLVAEKSNSAFPGIYNDAEVKNTKTATMEEE